MRKRAAFTVLVATDGSVQGQAAVRAAAMFPWPKGARAEVVVASGSADPKRPASVREAVDRARAGVANRARLLLVRRFPDVQAVVIDRPALDGILAEAGRVRARAIVVGSHGYTGLKRLWLGSVSRNVVRGATCPVLVVKGRLSGPRRLLVGLDGSPHSRRAVAFLASLDPPAGTQVTLLRVVESARVPSVGLLPASVRRAVASEVRALETQRLRTARRDVQAAGRTLARAGWRVRSIVQTGLPVAKLLDAARSLGADLIVVGARGVGGMRRLLLGSVAEGISNRYPRSVLLVR